MNPNARILDRTLRSDRPAPDQGKWSSPVRVQLWHKNACMGEAPVRIVDGVADDLKYRPKETIFVDRLVFVHNNTKIKGGVWVHRLPQVLKVPKGELLHLALTHMQLRDKFGHNLLG